MLVKARRPRRPTFLPHRVNNWRPLLGSLGLLAGVSVAAAVSMPGAMAAPGHPALVRARVSAGLEFPHASPPGLLLPGEHVTLSARVEHVESGRLPVGVAYVRGGTHGAFTPLAMRFSGETGRLTATVPARFLQGSVFEDYVVLRDPDGGQPATLPARGAAAPYLSWIVRHPVTIALGAHVFGHLSEPQAIVARAPVGSGPGQVGFENEPEFSGGPTSFDVGRDGTVWVADTWNKRLLAYAPGKPGAPVRAVTLPQAPLEVAASPSGTTHGTIYVMAGAPLHPWDPRTVYAISPEGKLLWSHLAAGYVFNPVMRVDGDGILWIDDPDLGWIPVTSRAGQPLTIAQQIYRTVAYQPLGGGWQLPYAGQSEHESRYGLASPAGTLQDGWLLTSRTAMSVLFPPARVGSDIVEIGEVLNTNATPHQYEYVIVQFSPAGKVLSQFSLDHHLVYGDTAEFSNVRVGEDGRVYFLQTSDKWGMRVARYTLRQAPAERTSPAPAPSQASPQPRASPAPTTSHKSTAPAAVTNQTPPASGGGLTLLQWAGISVGIAVLAALAGVTLVILLRRRGIRPHWPHHIGMHHT